jgi:hypothetical protein
MHAGGDYETEMSGISMSALLRLVQGKNWGGIYEIDIVITI